MILTIKYLKTDGKEIETKVYKVIHMILNPLDGKANIIVEEIE